jgi:hypothetical protein
LFDELNGEGDDDYPIDNPQPQSMWLRDSEDFDVVPTMQINQNKFRP